MNRVPFIQPQARYHNTPATTAHWYDENIDRRIVSPDGLSAVVFLCNKNVRKPSVFRPKLVRLSDNDTILRVTVSSGLYYFSSGWSNDVPTHRTRICRVPIEPDDVLATRLFAIYEGIKP